MRKKGIKNIHPTTAMLLGAAFAFLCYFILTLIFSAVSLLLDDPLGFVGIGAVAALIGSAIISSAVITKLRGEGGFLTALLSSLLFSLIQILIGLIIAGGNISLGVFFNYLCYLAISALTALISGRKRKKIKY